MSHYSEHQRMPAPVAQAQVKPVLDLARKLDIATNPDPAAIFEAGNGGFQVWCTPQDHPRGWSGITMNSGAFSKPCEYVGSVHWRWEDERIVALEIETTAYALADQKPDEYTQATNLSVNDHRRTIFNRDADIEWLKEKVAWLFVEAGAPLLPFEYEQAALSQIGPYILAHYISDVDEYVVIVSPELDPQEFRKPGYEVARTLEIWRAGEFPADVPLRPDYEYQEADTEPDEGPLVEQYENASHLGEDGWLEAAFEDSISGWSE